MCLTPQRRLQRCLPHRLIKLKGRKIPAYRWEMQALLLISQQQLASCMLESLVLEICEASLVTLRCLSSADAGARHQCSQKQSTTHPLYHNSSLRPRCMRCWRATKLLRVCMRATASTSTKMRSRLLRPPARQVHSPCTLRCACTHLCPSLYALSCCLVVHGLGLPFC